MNRNSLYNRKNMFENFNPRELLPPELLVTSAGTLLYCETS